MPRYDERPSEPESKSWASFNADSPPDPDTLVVETFLRPWVAKNGRLPPPCPESLYDCATWWRTQMQEPERRNETYIGPMNRDSGQGKRWECGYAMRLRASLNGFLSMPLEHRKTIVAGVGEDRVAYRGEPFAQYMRIWEETMKMREQNDSAMYVADALVATRAQLGRMVPP